MIGTVLKLKPVLQIQGEKLDAYAKVRGIKAAKKVMLEAMHKDFDTRFAKYVQRGEMCLQIAYCYGMEEAVDEWRREEDVLPWHAGSRRSAFSEYCLPHRPRLPGHRIRKKNRRLRKLY